MKRSIFLILFYVSVMIGALAQNDNDIFVVIVENRSPEEVYNNPERRRTPTRRLECIITQEGIIIPGYNTEDILAYEIYTVDGEPVASFVDEEDFITFIFSVAGTYEIRLQFEDITLVGFLEI